MEKSDLDDDLNIGLNANGLPGEISTIYLNQKNQPKIFYTRPETNELLLRIILPRSSDGNNAPVGNLCATHMHIVLDQSGSMAGAPFNNAILGISEMFECLNNKNFPIENIHFYAFIRCHFLYCI